MAPPRSQKAVARDGSGQDEQAREVHKRLAAEYPDARCELDHETPYQLLAATILSAQCTDARVNMVTPHLFKRYPEPVDLAGARLPELEEIVRSTGFYASKARNLVGMAQRLVEVYDSVVPGDMADLTSLPGVGRKTANVVRSVALGLPGLPVDTHVLRLSHRLDLTDETDPVKVEYALNDLLPAADRGAFGLRMILHGRRVCEARKPRCGECVLADICPSAGSGERGDQKAGERSSSERGDQKARAQRAERTIDSTRRKAVVSERSASRKRAATSSSSVSS